MNNGQIDYTSRWYAIYTKPKQEDRAEFNLRAWQVESFAPKIRKRCYSLNKPFYVTKPLFPRYIFARFKAGDLLHKVCFTRGIQSVVSFGDIPCPIDDEIISLIRSQQGEDGLVRLEEDLRQGDKIVIKEGPLRNFVGVFERKLKDKERIYILLTMVSYQSHVVIERELVRRANS
jgi:transcriptional antiterminator RfaH